MGKPVPKWTRRLLWVLGILTVLLAAFSSLLHFRARASLPPLEGELAVAGLRAEVTVTRDALGVPTIRAQDRVDAARALGFVHGQDRFFQMDAARRAAAGELAELMGPPVAELDRVLRLHRFRARAQRGFEELSGREKALIEAYAQGVNAGLASLGTKPPEYVLTLSTPKAWKPVDTILCGYAMYLNLQDSIGQPDYSRGLAREHLPEEVYRFIFENVGSWEAPLVGAAARPLEIPPAESWAYLSEYAESLEVETAPAERGGSNAWAVAGGQSADGSALLANDMHLGLQLPNTWYRAVLEYKDANGGEVRVVGVTLPGTPVVVSGSNGHVAWGITNAYTDTTDLVVVEDDPENPGMYLTPSGPQPYVTREETLRVRFRGEETLTFRETVWGPLVQRMGLGTGEAPREDRPTLALAWVAHRPGAIDLGILGLETAREIEEAMAVAHEARIPVQNLVLADRTGRVGWTLMGPTPQRRGFSGRRPVSFANGEAGWLGVFEGAEMPGVLDPAEGLIWSANNRMLPPERMEPYGNGGYDDDARQWQIRKRLRDGAGKHTALDMLAIQLDDESYHYQRWRDLLLTVLDEEAVQGDTRRQELRRLVEAWDGRAGVNSAGYALLRIWRGEVYSRVWGRLLAPLESAGGAFSSRMQRLEGPLFQLVSAQPDYLVDPVLGSWRAELLAAVDDVFSTLEAEASGASHNLDAQRWGELNRLRMFHPLGYFFQGPLGWPLAVAGIRLHAPETPLPGDDETPRVKAGGRSASQRMVVSPGREEEGYFHMPGGQSGHPMSPFYLAGHQDWVEGRPTPLLPGEALYELTLVPAQVELPAP